MAVKITVAAPVAPHKSLSAVKLFVHTTAEQSSPAMAPPWVESQVFKAAVLPIPSHSTVRSDA